MTGQPPPPLAEIARQYLTSDHAEAERTLLQTGTGAVYPVVQALVEVLRSFKSFSWGKSTLESYWDSALAHGTIDEEHRAMAQAEIDQTPDDEEPGVSMAQLVYSANTIIKARDLLDRIRGGQQALVQIIISEGSFLRCAAATILCGENPIGYTSVNQFANMAEFIDRLLHSEPTGMLLIMALAIAGYEPGIEFIKDLCRQHELTQEDLHAAIVNEAIVFIAKS